MLKDYNKKSLVILEYLFKIELYINKVKVEKGTARHWVVPLSKEKKVFFPLFCMFLKIRVYYVAFKEKKKVVKFKR